MTYFASPNHEKIRGWMIRQSQSSRVRDIVIGGQTVEMPSIREEFLLSLDPIRARENPSLVAGAAVDYLSTQILMEQLCLRLNIKQAGFDPSQMVTAIQYLSAQTNTAIFKSSFANSEQFKRMRVVRFLLYSGLITWIGGEGCDPATVEKACRELEQLQKVGQRLDHPVGGSKDTADARGIAIFLAAQDTIGEGQMDYFFSDHSLDPNKKS
jgi:hypothetical protein